MCACGNSYFQITSWLGAVYFGRSQLAPKPLDRAAELCDAVPKGACSDKFSSKSSRKTTKFTWKIAKFVKIYRKLQKKFGNFLQNFWIWSGAKECRSCRARKMLKNAPTLAIVAVHTEENEPSRILIWNTTNIYIHYLEPSLVIWRCVSTDGFVKRTIGSVCDRQLSSEKAVGEQSIFAKAKGRKR